MIKVDFYIPMSRMDEVTAWLLTNIGTSWSGNVKQRWSYGEHYESVSFSCEQDAIMFKLKWAGNETN